MFCFLNKSGPVIIRATILCKEDKRPLACIGYGNESSHHLQKVRLAQFSLYVPKCGLKPDSFYFCYGNDYIKTTKTYVCHCFNQFLYRDIKSTLLSVTLNQCLFYGVPPSATLEPHKTNICSTCDWSVTGVFITDQSMRSRAIALTPAHASSSVGRISDSGRMNPYSPVSLSSRV